MAIDQALLAELRKDVPAAEFKPYAYRSESGAMFAFWKPAADYSEVVADGLIVMKSIETGEVVGCRIAVNVG